MRQRLLFPLLLLWLFANPLHGDAQEKTKQLSCYLIGNSLTWDTVPSSLDGEVQWHVDCGKSLPWIYQHPEKPCVKSSVLWPSALKQKQFDVLCVQPHYGSTLDEDVQTIAKWIELQKSAVVVIHSGWSRSVSRAVEYKTKFADSPGNPKMVHCPDYVAALIKELGKRFPKTEFRQTRANELLNQVATDISNGTAPFAKIEDLYRDAIHMKLDSGRYLMHNAMRIAIGQPISAAGFKSTDNKIKQYLDGVLRKVVSKSADKR